MNEEEARRDITLLTIVGDLEAIGDVITHRFMSLARRRSRGQVLFSEEAQEDLIHYYRMIKEALQQVLAALATHNPMLVTQFLARKQELKAMKRQLHQRHIRQLRAQIPTSTKSSAVYLDLLDALSAVLAYASNIAYAFQETNGVPVLTNTTSFRTLRQFVPTKMVNTEQLYAASRVELAQNGRSANH
jgi:Na+/phosphate symporter